MSGVSDRTSAQWVPDSVGNWVPEVWHLVLARVMSAGCAFVFLGNTYLVPAVESSKVSAETNAVTMVSIGIWAVSTAYSFVVQQSLVRKSYPSSTRGKARARRYIFATSLATLILILLAVTGKPEGTFPCIPLVITFVVTVFAWACEDSSAPGPGLVSHTSNVGGRD